MNLLRVILLVGLSFSTVSHAEETGAYDNFVFSTPVSRYLYTSAANFVSTIARRIPLVTIQAESYPGIDYKMGFDLDSSSHRNGIFYQDPTLDPKEQYKDYSIVDLQAAPQVMVTANGGGKVFNVVQIAYTGNVITILYQPNVLKNKWASKKFTVECAGTDANCTAKDGDTGKPITSIYMRKGTFFGKTVGVSSIETR